MLLEACAQSERSWNPFRPPTADTVATVPPCVLGCLAELGEDADASLAAADVGSVLVELPAVVSAATAAVRLGRKVATVLVFHQALAPSWAFFAHCFGKLTFPRASQTTCGIFSNGVWHSCTSEKLAHTTSGENDALSPALWKSLQR